MKIVTLKIRGSLSTGGFTSRNAEMFSNFFPWNMHPRNGRSYIPTGVVTPRVFISICNSILRKY